MYFAEELVATGVAIIGSNPVFMLQDLGSALLETMQGSERMLRPPSTNNSSRITNRVPMIDASFRIEALNQTAKLSNTWPILSLPESPADRLHQVYDYRPISYDR